MLPRQAKGVPRSGQESRQRQHPQGQRRLAHHRDAGRGQVGRQPRRHATASCWIRSSCAARHPRHLPFGGYHRPQRFHLRLDEPVNVVKAALQILWGGAAPLGMGDGVGGQMRRKDKGRGMRGRLDIERSRGRRIAEVNMAK